MPEDNKTLYFLQLPHDFFGSRRIKKLRKMENGDSLVLLYLKIQLSTLKTGGVISLSGLEEDPAEEIALEISEEPEEVRHVLDFMLTFGLAETMDDGNIFLPFVEIMTTSHTKDAERMRKARKRKKEQESETARTQSERRANAARTIDEQTFDRIKSKEYRVESKEEKSEVIQHYPSQPTLPESDSSISDEIDCRTKNVRRKDVQQVIDAWNGTGLKQIERITPESKRGDMTRKRIRDYGLDKVLKAIENVKDSKFLCGENKKGWTATYDWFIRPENFQRVLEGNYDHQFQKEGIKTNNPFLKILEEEYEQD